MKYSLTQLCKTLLLGIYKQMSEARLLHAPINHLSRGASFIDLLTTLSQKEAAPKQHGL